MSVPDITAVFRSENYGDIHPCDLVEFCLDSRGLEPSRGSFRVTTDELAKIGDLRNFTPAEWALLRETDWELEMTDQVGAADTVKSLFIEKIERECSFMDFAAVHHTTTGQQYADFFLCHMPPLYFCICIKTKTYLRFHQ